MRRRTTRRSAVSEPPPDEAILPFAGYDLVGVQGRNYPALQTIVVPAGRLPAGMRTQPVVPTAYRVKNMVAYRVHRPVTQEVPGAPPPVQFSRFQPVALWQSGWTSGVPAGDWIPAPRFSGLWSRVGALRLPNPGDAQQTPAPRWTRVMRVARYSTLPPEALPA